MKHPGTKVKELVLFRGALVHPFIGKVLLSQVVEILVEGQVDRTPDPEQHVQDQVPVVIAYVYEVHFGVLLSTSFLHFSFFLQSLVGRELGVAFLGLLLMREFSRGLGQRGSLLAAARVVPGR